VDQNIGLGTFCNTDFSSKFHLRKFHKFRERKFNSIIKNFTKSIKPSKLKFINLSAFHVDCSYKPTSVQLSAVHTTLARTRLSVAMELSKTMMTTTPLLPPQTGAEPPPKKNNNWPMFIVAKRLHGSRCYLVRR